MNYSVYAGTVSGGPYFIQNGVGATAIGTNYVRTASTPASSGTQAPGANYAISTGAVIHIDNSAITTSITTTTITFTGYSPTSADVGNVVHLLTGTNITAGYWIITGWTSSTWTVDRNIPSSGTTTNATGFAGGPINTLTQAATAASVAGNLVWVLGNTTYAETLTWQTANANGATVTWVGYASIRGDGPTGSTRPIIDAQATRSTCVATNNKANAMYWFIFKNGTASNVSGTNISFFTGCRFTGSASNGISQVGGTCRDCEFDANTGNGFNTTGASTVLGCVAHGNAVGFNGTITQAIFCLSYSNVGSGFALSFGGDRLVVSNCTSRSNTGVASDGFQWSGVGGYQATFVNNISDSNGRYGFNRTGSTVLQADFDYNLYSSNATAGLNNTNPGPHDVTTAPTFVSTSNENFALAGGSAGRAVGHAIAAVTTTSVVNIGVSQNSSIINAAGGAILLIGGSLVGLGLWPRKKRETSTL